MSGDLLVVFPDPPPPLLAQTLDLGGYRWKAVGNAAVATRKKMFDRAAADRMLVTGYHFPFPACGHLIKTASGYEHVPVEWPPTL